VDAPSFIRFVERASLAEIVRQWAPETGCSAAQLVALVAHEARLANQRRGRLLDWSVFSLVRDEQVDASEHLFRTACWRRGTLAEGDAAFAEDVMLSAAELERFAATLNLPAPSWLSRWQSFAPDLLDEMLRQYGSPTDHPRRSKGFYDEFRARATGGDRHLIDDSIRSRIRRRKVG
jgi:hypothetical protein